MNAPLEDQLRDGSTIGIQNVVFRMSLTGGDRPGAATPVLSEALALLRGHALDEFIYEPVAAREVPRCER